MPTKNIPDHAVSRKALLSFGIDTREPYLPPLSQVPGRVVTVLSPDRRLLPTRPNRIIEVGTVMVKRQLELGISLAPESGKPFRRNSMLSRMQHGRQNRSQWWFARMRQVVDDANPEPRAVT